MSGQTDDPREPGSARGTLPEVGDHVVTPSLRRAHVIAVAVFAAIVVGLHLPGLMEGPTMDGALFTEIAVGMRSGLILYRDLWDHKPPGVFVAFALVQAALPGADPWFAPWLLTVVASILIAVLTYMLLLPGGRRAALIGGAVVAGYVSIYPISLGGGQTEPLATVVLLAAFVLAGRATGSARSAAACGVLAGLAVMMSLLVLPAILAVGILVAAPRASAADWRGAGRRLGAFALGGSAVVAIAAGAVLAAGILPSAWSALVTYNGVYGAVNRSHSDHLVAMVSASILFLAPLIVLCAIGFLRWMRTRGIQPSVVAAAAWVAACSFAIAATGRLEPHYLIVVIPPLTLLAIPAGRAATADLGGGRMAGTALVAVAMLVAAPAAVSFAARSSSYTNQPQVRAVAAWLRSRTVEPAALFVWGDQPELYYTSGMLPATPYLHVLPLLTPGYGGEELSRTVAQELAADPPRWVVDAGSKGPGEPGSVPLLVWRPVESDGRSLDTIDPIRQVVRDGYGPPVEVAGWLVYERLPVTPVQ